MRLLPRYVLIEFVKVFPVTVTTLTTIMMLAGVAKEAIDQGLGLIHVLQMLPYILPNALCSRCREACFLPRRSYTVACRGLTRSWRSNRWASTP